MQRIAPEVGKTFCAQLITLKNRFGKNIYQSTMTIMHFRNEAALPASIFRTSLLLLLVFSAAFRQKLNKKLL
jgi:hypothetical protein